MCNLAQVRKTLIIILYNQIFHAHVIYNKIIISHHGEKRAFTIHKTDIHLILCHTCTWICFFFWQNSLFVISYTLNSIDSLQKKHWFGTEMSVAQ